MTQQSVGAAWRHAALVTAVVAALGMTACKKPAPAAPVAAQPAATEAPAAPVDTDADLLTKAKTAENEKRLYAPAGNNAIEYYLALRERNPKDDSAKNALTDLFPYAMIATEQNLKKGDEPGRVEAARIFALLERVDTNAPSLPRLRAMMQKEAADELKLQQDAAKKAQDDLVKQTAAAKAAAAAAAGQPTPPPPAPTNPEPTPPPQTAPATTAATQPATQPRPTPAETPPPTPAPTPPPAPKRVGLPDVISSVQPNYPRDALRDGVAGEVTVSFTVNADGSVSGASIVSANPRHVFDSAALDAIRKWRFEAPGEPVTGRRTFAFNPGN